VKIKKWIRDGHYGVSGDCEDLDDLMDAAGRAMDKAYAQDIFPVPGLIMGEIIFFGEDGKAYVGAVSFGVSEADEDYLEAVLDEEEIEEARKLAATAKPGPKAKLEERYRDWARDEYHLYGDLEFDPDCKVSIGEDGAYVQCWKFVNKEQVLTLDELAENEPPTECAFCGSRNFARLQDFEWECHDCGKTWDMSDAWADAEELELRHGGEHPLAPKSEWQRTIMADKTTRGYWNWVAAMLPERLEKLKSTTPP